MAPQDPYALAQRYEASEPSEHNYEAICAAVMETARGRWFLAEYARRNRNADTEALLNALARIEAQVGAAQPTSAAEQFRAELRDIAGTIRQTRLELRATARESIKASQVLALLEQLERCVEKMLDADRGQNPEPSAAEEQAPASGRAHLTVVPLPVRASAELPAVEPIPAAKISVPLAAGPKPAQTEAAPGHVPAPAGIERVMPMLSELESQFDETSFAVPAPSETSEPVPAPIQSPGAWLPAYAHPDAPEPAHDNVFVPFEIELNERPITTEASAAAEMPKAAPSPPPRATAQPRARTDPLAPLMALSEEERIALFT